MATWDDVERIALSLLLVEEPADGVFDGWPTWMLRGDRKEKAVGGGANDKLSARGALGATFATLVRDGKLQVETSFGVTHVTEREGRLRIAAGSACCGRHVSADELIVATGFRPDLSMLGEIRLSLDPALDCPASLAPLIDPKEHSGGTVRPHAALPLRCCGWRWARRFQPAGARRW